MFDMLPLGGTEGGSGLSALVAGVVAAIFGAAFAIQRLIKSWKETEIESNVVSLMHTELTRLADQNRILGEELGKFQQEVIKLNRQLNDLSLENNRLHREVVALTQEVSALQEIIRTTNPDFAASTTAELKRATLTQFISRKELEENKE